MEKVLLFVLASLFAADAAVAGEKLDLGNDKNNDGYLSQDEWPNASFDKLDKNGDLRLEVQELRDDV